MNRYSIIIPAFNEEGAVGETVRAMRAGFEALGRDADVTVVDDGSADRTAEHAAAAGAKVIRNPINSGYGLSLKRGIRAAAHPHVVIIDADATYPVSELPRLVAEYEKGYDMVVAQRTGSEYRRGLLKYPARLAFTAIAEFAVGRRIPDINSGYRIFRKDIAERFREDLCDGFSFTTTITLLSMLQGYFVNYLPVPYHARVGSSKVRHMRDSLRVLQLIVRAILLYNPIKLFLLIAVAGVIVSLAGLIVAGWAGQWAIGGLFVAVTGTGSMIIFALGLVAEVLAMLRPRLIRTDDDRAG